MSETGNRGFFGNRGPAPQNNANNSSGQSGPQRDAWNQVIKQEPVRNEPNNQGGNGNGSDNTDNTGIDESTIDNIWEDVKKENSTTDNNNQNNNNNNQPIVEPDKKKQMADYLEGVGLAPMVLSDSEKEDLKNGNFDGLLAKMNDRTVQAHLKALSGSQALIADAIKKGVKEAVDTTRSQEAGVRNVAALESALPFTKDKVIGPIAQSIMQRFLNRGMNTEDAIKGTKKAFEHMNKTSGGNVNVNKNLSGNFNNSDNDNDGNDWLSVLRPNG